MVTGNIKRSLNIQRINKQTDSNPQTLAGVFTHFVDVIEWFWDLRLAGEVDVDLVEDWTIFDRIMNGDLPAKSAWLLRSAVENLM